MQESLLDAGAKGEAEGRKERCERGSAGEGMCGLFINEDRLAAQHS